jgi:hypothetical protein
MLTVAQIKTGIRICREQGLGGVARAFLDRISRVKNQNGPVSQSWTAYMDWLTYANAGMLTPGNAYCVNYAIKNIQSKSPIVEIGSFCGLSANMIAYFKEKYNVKNPLVTCDKWIFEGAEKGGMLGDSRTVSHDEYKDFVKETFIRNVQMFSRYDLPYTMEMFSDEFFSSWHKLEKRRDVFGREFQLGGPISFCYIDGNHSYEFAKRDFANCDKYLEGGGFLLFDDSSDGSGYEVCRVVQEVLKNGRYELVAKNPNYFFRKNK